MRMRALICVSLIALFGVTAKPSAAVELTQQILSQCAADVRASGTFALIENSDGGHLVSASGASSRDIANVNDCLADVQQIQYTALATLGVEEEDVTGVNCRKRRNEQIAIGLLLTAGVVAGLGATDAAIIGGVLGSAVGVGKLQNEYKKCLKTQNALAGSQGVSFGGACRGGKSILQGGTGYCFR